MLVVSLIESTLILPRHLSHLPDPDWKPTHPVERFFSSVQTRVDAELKRFVEGPLDRGVRAATRHPVVVIAAGIAMLIICVALVPAGILGVVLAQRVESDIVVANLEMPAGTPARRTADLATTLEAAGRRAIDRLSTGRPDYAAPLLAGVNLAVGMKPRTLGGAIAQEPHLRPQANIAAVEFKLLEAESRDISSGTFLQAWRQEAGTMPEARSLTFSAELLDLGLPVQAELSHPDTDRLGQIGDAVSERLRQLEGVFDVQSDHAVGLQEIQLELRPEARSLGLTLDDLARQVRSAFFGDESLRIQRGREDVQVYVRLPARERDAIADVESYLVRTPAGAEVPLHRVAETSLGHSPSSIRRKDGQRIVTVTADVDTTIVTGAEVNDILATTILPDLADDHPGLRYAFGGEQQQQLESFDSLARGFVLALLFIYSLLAIPLGSYTKPLIIMAVIPFGLVGAILGHLIMGIDLSIASMWGIIGLTGVVVNDSLVMIDFINEKLRQGAPARSAIIDGAKGRFRPIFLTSLTTFLGFSPLIFEQSIQAKFLIPLGVSMGFGNRFCHPDPDDDRACALHSCTSALQVPTEPTQPCASRPG